MKKSQSHSKIIMIQNSIVQLFGKNEKWHILLQLKLTGGSITEFIEECSLMLSTVRFDLVKVRETILWSLFAYANKKILQFIF